MKHPFALAFLSVALLLLGACSHNDQRNCTTDCHIGGGGTVVTSGIGYVSPSVVYHRSYRAPSLYHPYRGYGRGHGNRRGWHGSATVIIR